jgi:hypothetical protein
MTEDAEKRFWAGGLDKISWQVGIEEGIEAGVRAERERVLDLLADHFGNLDREQILDLIRGSDED